MFPPSCIEPMRHQSSTRGCSPLDDDVYRVLVRILSGHPPLVSKRDRTDIERKAFCHYYSRKFSLQCLQNPLTGTEEELLVYVPSGGKIVPMASQVNAIVRAVFTDTKGEGAKKIMERMRKIYVGVSKSAVQQTLNAMHVKQRVRPVFFNKPPVEASEVMERNQIDLVDFQRMPVEHEGTQYNFVLSIMDIFSRYVFLSPLSSKHAHVVADVLYRLYSIIGPPRIIQCDNGKEFKGVVKTVAKSLNSKMVRGRPYHPQSQGKVCPLSCK